MRRLLLLGTGLCLLLTAASTAAYSPPEDFFSSTTVPRYDSFSARERSSEQAARNAAALQQSLAEQQRLSDEAVHGAAPVSSSSSLSSASNSASSVKTTSAASSDGTITLQVDPATLRAILRLQAHRTESQFQESSQPAMETLHAGAPLDERPRAPLAGSGPYTGLLVMVLFGAIGWTLYRERKHEAVLGKWYE